MAHQLFSNYNQKTPWYYPGKIRKQVVIFLLISLALSPVLFFIGNYMVGLWSKSNLNPEPIQGLTIQEQTYQNLIEPEVLPVEKNVLKDGTQVFYTNIVNPAGQNLIFSPLKYRLTILDGDSNVLETENGSTRLLPNESAWIIKNTRIQTADKIQIEILLAESEFYFQSNSQSEYPRKPQINTSGNQIEPDFENQKITFKTRIFNPENFEIQDLDMVYILRGREQNITNIGQFKITNIPSREDYQLELTIPMNENSEVPVFLDLRPKFSELVY